MLPNLNMLHQFLLRWLVPVSLFFDSFNFKRTKQKGKPKPQQHLELDYTT